MFSRILVANRGEIALRIIRACRDLGVETVAVYSEADKDALYLDLADYSICIGPAASSESYLNMPRIISAAEITDVQALHPGCGFLAENAHFAEICESSNIKFIGPSAETIRLAGNKSEAIRIAHENKVSTVPGSGGVVEDDDSAIKAAKTIGYPVIVKAAAGGGGKGMRIAHNDMSLVNNLFLARREAQVSFKDSSVYVEKYIEGARHIEVQVLADQHENFIHLGLRDCSLQRRHQKLIEESPPHGLSDSLAQAMCKAALKIARAVKYSNAGTVEFLVDKKGRFYFIELNARLQVEHPITEMVTGVDIVKQQLLIASGERLKIRQKQVHTRGVAIECRINAEDPNDGFKPSPGVLKLYNPPGGPGVRVDSYVHTGCEIPASYDPLIGKLIVHQRRRDEAIAVMRRALDEYVIEGINTTVPLYQSIFGNRTYRKGQADTSFIDRFFQNGV